MTNKRMIESNNFDVATIKILETEKVIQLISRSLKSTRKASEIRESSRDDESKRCKCEIEGY